MTINCLKKEFLNRLKQDLSIDDYNAYITSFDKPETHGFTINLKKLKISNLTIDDIRNKFDAKLLFLNDNFAYFLYDKKELAKKNIYPGKDPLYHTGLYYIQEPTAAKVLYNVDFNPNEAVLDLCASPGGKSIEALYNLDVNAGGFLVANEIDKDRVKILLSNIERSGFQNIIILNNDSSELVDEFGDSFNKVIVDAPCSGEGMFRKSEEAIKQWSEALVKHCAILQKNILDDAYKMVKLGGMLIYSTCTFSKDEDEYNVDYMLNKYENLKLLHIEKNYMFNSDGEGQFFAIFKKGEECINNINSFPSIKQLKNLNVVRYGLKVENIKNGYKEPSHAITHNDDIKIFGNNIIELDDSEVEKYLHGDVIRKDVGIEGWCKVTYKGLGLGLVKVKKGVLKNHYPKGLRKR